MSAYSPMVPYCFPEQPGSQAFSLYDRLLQERLIFLNRPIDSEIANYTIAAMLYLDAEDTNRDIQLYINSQSGLGRESLTAGLAIYDTMQCLESSIRTVCTGMTTGVATFLLATGTQGKRLALPNARIMLSQPLHNIYEQSASKIEIEARELLQLRQIQAGILAQATGQLTDKILEDTERDLYFSAQAALDYGLIDNVISRE